MPKPGERRSINFPNGAADILEKFKTPALGLVICLIVLTLVFKLLDIQASFDRPNLLLGLFILFVGIPGILVSWMAGRAFLKNGIWAALFMGIGTLTFALTNVFSTSASEFFSTNIYVTAHNTGSLLAGYLHLLGAFFLVNQISNQVKQRSRYSSLLQVYLASLALLVLLIILSIQQIFPPFFIQGLGGTPVRQIVVGLASVFFLISGLIYFWHYHQSRSSFFYWYSLGLILTALGMIGILLQSATGTPLNWVGRGSQIMAGIFLFFAALVVLRDARQQHVSSDEVLAGLLTRTEDKLKASEEQLRFALESSYTGTWDLDLVDRTAFRSLEHDRIFGYNELLPEWTYEMFLEHVVPEDRDEVNARFSHSIETGGDWNFECRIRRTDGAVRWIWAIGRHQLDQSGTPHRMAGIVQDITERKKVEERLEGTNQRINQILDSIQEDFYVLDRQWNFVYASKNFTSRIGKDPEDFVGNNIWQMFPKHLGTILEENFRTVMDKREVRRFEVGGKYTSAVYSMAAFPSGEGITVLGSDITEQRKAEEALKESEERFKTLAAASPVGLGVVSISEGKFLFVNPAYEKAFGYSPDELLNLQSPDIYEDISDRERILNLLKQNDNKAEYEVKLKRKDGSTFWGLCSTRPINFDGKLALLGAFIDISDRKQAEEDLKKYTADLEMANRELEAFSYSVSHDLRTPLRTLDGFSEMVIMDYGEKLDETGKDYLNRIRKASQTMSRLTEDILKLSRITRADMRRDEVNLSEMAGSIADELKVAQPGRQAEFIIASDIIVNGDKALLQILLRNLMENSWKYSSQRLNTRIEFGVSHQEARTVYFIKDNGIGFDMKYADKLFQPFQRLHTDKEFPGTGIGLATAQRVIRRHWGEIWADSEVGKGTTFYFTLS
jgi:PAS domain S-box-containing protein